MGRRTFSELGVLGLYTESPLHCGTESGAGYVDLPIQRERHTHYPVIPGSTLKGVLKDELRGAEGLDEGEVLELFGYSEMEGEGEDKKAKTRPGRIAFGDSTIAAFPVRSSGAPFHWVTCPFVLERVLRSLGRPALDREPEPGHAWAAEGGGDGPVLLEELALTPVARADLFDPDNESSVVHALLALLPDGPGFAHTRKIFPQRLLIVRDEDFGELVEIGTEVVTRIKLNYLGTTAMLKKEEHLEEDGTERPHEDCQGNLFVQELVPPETLFVAPLRAMEKETSRCTKLLGALEVIRVGGDETVGRGVTHTRWWQPPASNGKEA